MRSPSPARSMFPRAIAARSGSASRVISMPSAGNACAIQMAEYPMHVPTSRMRRAPVAITSDRSRRADAGCTSGSFCARPSASMASMTGSTGGCSVARYASTWSWMIWPIADLDCKLKPMRHTKIVATLGPASDGDAVLDQLMVAGVDVFRLNFSHGTHETHAALYARVRAAADRAGRTIAVLQDLSGPKIRTGRNAGGAPIALKRGDELSIITG